MQEINAAVAVNVTQARGNIIRPQTCGLCLCAVARGILCAGVLIHVNTVVQGNQQVALLIFVEVCHNKEAARCLKVLAIGILNRLAKLNLWHVLTHNLSIDQRVVRQANNQLLAFNHRYAVRFKLFTIGGLKLDGLTEQNLTLLGLIFVVPQAGVSLHHQVCCLALGANSHRNAVILLLSNTLCGGGQSAAECKVFHSLLGHIAVIVYAHGGSIIATLAVCHRNLKLIFPLKLFAGSVGECAIAIVLNRTVLTLPVAAYG